jgi:carboxyl-terminal processing protease
MMLPLFLLFAAAPVPVQDAEDAVKKLVNVLTTVQREAADPVSSEQAVYQGAIPGMLRQLDPHSVFFDPGQFEQLKAMERSEQKGFGSVVSVLPGRVIVLQALPNTPSGKAGLSPGDEILAINNVALASLSFDQLVGFLGQSRQQTAHLIVRRPGNARMLEFTLNPELVDAPSVDRAFMLRPGLGYIRVASFDPQTGPQLKRAIEQLGGEKLGGLVLDLRNNLGGVVDAALQSAALFLKSGQRILSIKGRKVQSEDVDVPKGLTPYSFPIAILINAKTASAAEILTGALQDHDRAAVLGEPSYGKGLVQSVMQLSGDTGLALTTAFYYTPSGRSIQKPLKSGQLEFSKARNEYKTDTGRPVLGGGGIQPDVLVLPEQTTQLRAALEASGTITNFATEYTQNHKIDATFQVTPGVLDDFQVFASQRGIQPSVGEWFREREWLQNRIRQEVFNQALGVAKGDEIEAQSDAVVKAAIEKLFK